MNDKQSIPTIYKGVRMKSRIHADVAFLLDRLGWKWDYQPQSFFLENGHHYLPDFHVPHLSLWIAALDHEPDADEEAQLEGFPHHLPELEDEAGYPTYLLIKHAGGTQACYFLPNFEPEPAPGGYLGFCFHCRQWVYQEHPIEEELGCPECVPNPGQVARWFWLEGRNGALYVCTEGHSWLLREWVTTYKEQEYTWEATHRTIACAFCNAMFDIKDLGINIIMLGPGEPLPPTWITLSHQGVTDYYCTQICAAASLLSTIVNTKLRKDSASPIGQHSDALTEVENMLYRFIPGATHEPSSEA